MGDKNPTPKDGRLPISELLNEYQGANSPFGDDVKLPLPADALRYEHPEIAPPHGE